MSQKKLLVFILLALSSIFSGAVLGLLDIFGFVDGRHALSFTILALTLLLIYTSLLCVFILNFAEKNRISVLFMISAGLFATTFFIMNLNPILTVLASISYFVFLVYAYSSSVKRSELFIKFSPKDIFFPTLKNSFLYLLVLLALLAFTQSQTLISQNNLISPPLLKVFIRPVSITLNQQINGQIQSEFGSVINQLGSQKEKEVVVHEVLSKTVQAMANKNTRTIYGLDPDEIPITKAIVFEDGTIDLTPVFEAILPLIAENLNQQIQQYAIFAPGVIALLTFIILQPFILPIQIVETILTVIIFKLLVSSGFIIITKETKEVERLHL